MSAAQGVRDRARQPPAPRRPAATPPATPIAVLLALLVLAAGAVLIRDALVAWNVIGGTEWAAPVLRGVDGLAPASWMVPAGVALTLAGLWFVVAALAPRRHPEVSLGSSGTAWIRRRDLARVAGSTARDVAGVVRAQATASRRAVRVQVVTTAADPEPIRAAVTDAVTRALAPLHPVPAVRVRARTLGGVR